MATVLEFNQYLLSDSLGLNPVRAVMVSDPSCYSWSSYQCNALGKITELLTPHNLYMQLGRNDEERQASYRELFKVRIDGKLLDEVRKSTNKGLALGSEKFLMQIN